MRIADEQINIMLILWFNSSISRVPPPRRGSMRPILADSPALDTISAAFFRDSSSHPIRSNGPFWFY
ncbi:hypothetical protein LptCag_0045 [Leptospirillum ferriphilum]|uniref:Uncharacterized protein n=1 Tax=Leptospirillum ferriphilum TaxID=178606 RepID=A0A094WCP7_9BACT|nr:hypothetical protein LptCag_0045 [Leptospirillum ferriphilum]